MSGAVVNKRQFKRYQSHHSMKPLKMRRHCQYGILAVSRFVQPASASILALMLVTTSPAVAQADRAALAAKLEAIAQTNAEAAYHLGMMKQLGIGGPKDAAVALALFRKGADAGDPLAAYKLGCYYAGQGAGLIQDDPALALKWKLVAAEAGYALAQHDVARLYFDAGDMDAALEWLTRSGQQGYADSLAALASLNNSDAIPKDGARTYAYFTLFLQRTAEPSQKQRDWLTKFAAELPDGERARGDAIVRDWKTAPTPLTAKALGGLGVAEALVAKSR